MKILRPLVYIICFGLVFLPSLVIYHTAKNGDGFEALRNAKGIPTFLAFIGVVFIFSIYSRFRYRNSQHVWKTGVFDQHTPFTQDSLLQAYVRLGGLMLRKDTEDLKGKMTYLHRYFDKHFEDFYSNELSTALRASFHHPVELPTITPWLKTNLRSTSQRSQLLYFLAGLSTVDGSINPREKRYLLQLAEELDITRKDFDSIMAMYTRFEDAFNNQQKQQRPPSKSRSQYKREKAAKVLGISVNASIDEIKKAYRGLAKVHHPDRFVGESESQQKIAEERFIQIQQAYELMLEFKN